MRKTLLIGSIVLAALSGCSRTDDTVIATVGGEKIHAGEFRLRLKTYLESTGMRDNIVVRKQIVDNMINEVLILQHVRAEGWEREHEVLKRYEEIENQALLDEYAKRLVTEEVQVEEPELWEEFRRMNTKVAVRYLYGKTEDQAWELRQRLERGATFDRLAREVFDDPGLANNGGFLGYFGKGEMDEAFEAVAFSLSPGSLSNPVRMRAGYAILRVEDRKSVPLASEHDYAKVKDKLVETVRDRKIKQAIESRTAHIADNLKPVFDEQALDEVVAAWNSSRAMEPEAFESSARTKLRHDAELVMVQGKPWTVKMFLDKFAFVTEKQRRRLKTKEDMKTAVLGLATRDVLLERARKEGMEQEQSVRRQIENVKKSYLLKRWAAKVQDAAGAGGIEESLLREQFEKHRGEFQHSPEVNVAEILVRSESEAGEIRRRIERGESFSGLARRHSIRTWAAKQGGVLGFGPRSKYGIIADKLFAAGPNEIVGPVFVDPYFGIFKILGKKEGRPKSFEEVKAEIHEQLLRARRQAAVPAALAQLRSGASFSVNDHALEYVNLDAKSLVKEEVR